MAKKHKRKQGQKSSQAQKSQVATPQEPYIRITPHGTVLGENQIVRYRLKPEVKLLGAILFILSFLFLIYTSGILNRSFDEPKDTEQQAQGRVETNDSPDQPATIKRVDAATKTSSDKAAATQSRINKSGVWMATDYEKGDIGIGNYTVRKGDTLWEIAEAVYGDGSKWHKLLNRNRKRIGVLADGSPALIVTGQVLVIPSK